MKIFMTILTVGSFLLSCNADVFVVFGQGSTIYVTSSAGSVIKQFYISSSSSSIKGIAVHYEEDLIFAVNGNKIFKLYLLDNEGKPKKSGSGQLFLNAKASHFESVLLVLSDAGIQPTRFSDEATSLTVLFSYCKWAFCGMAYLGNRPTYFGIVSVHTSYWSEQTEKVLLCLRYGRGRALS